MILHSASDPIECHTVSQNELKRDDFEWGEAIRLENKMTKFEQQITTPVESIHFELLEFSQTQPICDSFRSEQKQKLVSYDKVSSFVCVCK